MSANVETMAYAGQKPWHGLGTAVEEGISTQDMLVAAGLDWTVSKRYVRMKYERDSEETHPIPGYVAIARDTDNVVYQVATPRYKIVQNAQVMNFFRHWAEAGDATIETAGSLGNGSKIWALARIKSADVQVGEGDQVKTYVLLANSHDGTMGLTGLPTTVRVVCNNTLSVALSNGKQKEGRFVMRHTAKFDTAKRDQARKQIEVAITGSRQFQEEAQELAETQINVEDTRNYVLQVSQPDVYAQLDARTDRERTLAQIFHGDSEVKLSRRSRGIMDAILNGPGANLETSKGTLWGALNGVTHYVDHNMGRNRDTALNSAWFGQGNQFKNDAREMALAIARR